MKGVNRVGEGRLNAAGVVPRSVLAQYPAGVVAICAIDEGEPRVLVASSFSLGVSEQPPLALVSVQHSSTTWPRLRQLPSLGVSVLAEEHAEICRQLSSSADRDRRLEGIPLLVEDDGAAYLAGAPLHFSCHVHDVMPAGDHDIVLLHIDAYADRPEVAPLLFHRSTFATVAHVADRSERTHP